MYTRVSHELKLPTLVVESHAFRRRPAAVLSRYCGWLNVHFEPAMLSWEPGPIRQWAAHEGESQAKWHAALEASCRIEPPQSRRTEIRPEHAPIIERAMRIYRILSDRVEPANAATALSLKDDEACEFDEERGWRT